MDESSTIVTELIAAFGRGDADAGAELLARYRPWLRLLARLQFNSRFQRRFDASDIVQQTMLAACRDFPAFRGTSEGELKAWLRRILAHALRHEMRQHGAAQKRDIAREISLDQQLAESSQRLQAILAADDSSPSHRAMRREQELFLAEVLERLPADYREIIILRNLQGLSHEEAAQRLGRTVGATRMLWVRALARLRTEARAADPP